MGAECGDLSVCLSARTHISRTTQIQTPRVFFLCMLPVAARARSSDGVETRYVFVKSSYDTWVCYYCVLKVIKEVR